MSALQAVVAADGNLTRPLGFEKDRDKRVHVHFRTQYYTQWGQSITLCGAGGCNMACRCYQQQ